MKNTNHYWQKAWASLQAVLCLSIWICTAAPLLSRAADPAREKPGDYHLFARTNLAAWCIVPFDARKRGPEERAAMLEKLGFKLFAYDYRAEHVPTFDAELEALKRHHIRLLAWWFPWTMNDEARLILGMLQRHNLRDVQLWVSGDGEPTQSEVEQKARVEAFVSLLREELGLKPPAEAANRGSGKTAK